MNDDKRLACARLAYSMVGTYYNEQSENKTRATWELGRWREKWEREPCLSPAPAGFSHFFLHLLTVLTELLFTTILGAWNRLSFVQISSIYWKTTAKVWNWYQEGLWRNGTRISVRNISLGKTGLPFQVFRCSRKFSVGKTQKVVFHLLSVRISRKIFVNGGGC